MNSETIWKTALGELEITLSKASFTTWFKDTFIHSYNGQDLIIGVPNSFALEWLKNKFHNKIYEALKKVAPDVKEIKYEILTKKPILGAGISQPKSEIKVAEQITAEEKKSSNSFLDDKYIFETFIVGNNNRLAYATSQAVTNQPGTLYNPLFIYGGVGLGKTHLIQAIGNEIKKEKPEAKIIYVSCEQFTSEFIAAISNNQMDKFKKHYRNADVLLIDDIQFLSYKEGIQEEFFHTFNALHQNKRQIVLTSDRVHSAIPAITDRLSSRFGAGMVADIKPPNFETRVAILKAKAEERNYNLSEKVLEYIAENIPSNVRELNGALMRLVTHAEINNVEPDLDLASIILSDLIQPSKTKNIDSGKVIKMIAEYYNIKTEEILGEKRNKELVYPRQIAMYLIRKELNFSFPKIAKDFGGKDHTTVIHAFKKIDKAIKENPALKNELSLIKDRLFL